MRHKPEEQFMRRAMAEALKSRQSGDYAIGSIVVLGNTILSASGNRIKLDCDPTQRAEVAAIRLACAQVGSRHLPEAILYTTAEPCPMCTTAAICARIGGIVYGSTVQDMAEFRTSFGNSDFSWRTFRVAARDLLTPGNPELFLVEGFLREDCIRLFHHS